MTPTDTSKNTTGMSVQDLIKAVNNEWDRLESLKLRINFIANHTKSQLMSILDVLKLSYIIL